MGKRRASVERALYYLCIPEIEPTSAHEEYGRRVATELGQK